MPRGERVHVVRPGDCVESIAASFGCGWQPLWEHPRNAALRALRGDPNLLAPGDLVRLPVQLAPRGNTVAKGGTHTFEGTAPTTMLDVRFVERPDDAEEGEAEGSARPVAGAAYVVRALDVERYGTTTSDGRVREAIPVAARLVRVTLHPGTDHARETVVDVGGLDPIDAPSGVVQRLQNLGLLRAVAGDAEVAAAIASLQRARGLPDDGVLDDATRAALRAAHDGDG